MLSKLFFFAALLSAQLYAFESRTVIGLIDTGIDLQTYPELQPYLCDHLQFDETNTDNTDRIGHGSLVALLAVNGLPKDEYCIAMCKWLDVKHSDGPVISNCINRLIDANARYLNMSLGGTGYDQQEKDALQRAIDARIQVFVAAGNNGKNLDIFEYYPPKHNFKSPYFHVVGADDYAFSNFGAVVTDHACAHYGNATGTSFSTPRILNQTVKRERLK